MKATTLSPTKIKFDLFLAKSQTAIETRGKALTHSGNMTKHYLLHNLEILLEAMQNHNKGDNETTAVTILKAHDVSVLQNIIDKVRK